MSVLENVPLARIGGGAHKTDYRRVALLILAGVLYVVGWLPGRAYLGLRIIAVWAAHTWAGTAVRVGFADGLKPPQKR